MKYLLQFVVFLLPLSSFAQTGAPTAAEVSKIFAKSCAGCHTGEQAASKLRLDTLAGLAAGGATGAAIVPGHSADSAIWQRVATTDQALRMPPASAPLPAESVKILKDWIDAGAPGLPVTLAAVDYTKEVEPIFRKNCFGCHSGTAPKSQLRLDSRAGIARGGIGGVVVIAGDAEKSRLIHRVEGRGGEQRMPLKMEPLSATDIATLRKWIDTGAKFPKSMETSGDEGLATHWSYKKPVRPAVPSVNAKAAVSNPIDAFILSKLEANKLAFSALASRETLLRRVSLDLTGLPPSPAEVDAFVNDKRPDAYERVVDRLLASPHYGERWARHWLDLARYADTNGFEKDDRRTMWKYRDWVISAFNKDMPWDQFTIEQIAGDMLPNPTVSQKVASGFNRNTMYNEEGGVDKDEAYFEVLVDRVATTSTVWLGSTLACAQCHNHKYDPFTHKDYYSMMAFFSNNSKKDESYGDTSTKYREPELDLATPDQETQRQQIRNTIDTLETKLKTQTPELVAEQKQWEAGLRKAETEWKPLVPTAATALAGATLKIGADGILSAAGENAQRETYTLEAPLTGGKLTGIRLKALPDASLPRGGPGRDTYGNFIVSDVVAEIGTGANWTPLKFKRFVADDGRMQSKKISQLWTVDASREDTRLPRQLVLVTEKPVQIPANARIRLRIVQNSDYLGQTIGRFQMATTGSADPSVVVKLQAGLRPVFETAPEKRSEADAKRLADSFRNAAPSLEASRDQLREAKDSLKRIGIVTALVMDEKPGSDRPYDFVRIRGGFASKGEKVYADIPAALGTLPKGETPNRLTLARWLGSKDNPLTARVAVNRFWESFFGRGIVETSEDFGSQGEKPTNQELLDWLAVEFMDKGWSMKSIHRTIVTSTAYRQASNTTPELLKVDPYNRLMSRGPRFRMEAEMVRDSALAESGLLSAKVGGPSVFPYQPAGVWDLPYNDDTWQESKGGDQYRRGIYTFVRRSAMYPAMLNFDATSRETCTVRRIRTNTPLAALTTMNDAGYFQMAQALAQRIVNEGGNNDAARVDYGFKLVSANAPNAREKDRILTWLDGEKKYFGAHPDESVKVSGTSGKADLAPWTMLANVLLNLDGTITKE